MNEFIATVTSKGQITIPAGVRRHLELKEGDRVVFVVETEGEARLTVPRYPTVASLRGAAGALKKNVPWRKMRAMAREDRTRPPR